MTDDHTAPPPADALVPAITDEEEAFDPTDYDWIPVRRVPRADGWSQEKQRLFIATLADTGSVVEAAREVRMSRRSAYALRRAHDGAGFAAAWDIALRQAMHGLLDAVTERAMEGVEEPIFNREGHIIAHKRRFSDRLAMFLLRAHMPDRFDAGRRDERERGTALPAPRSMAEAMTLLDPPTPAEPHRLCPPDDLDSLIHLADLMPGTMPRAYRDRDPRCPYEPSAEELRLQANADAILRRGLGQD